MKLQVMREPTRDGCTFGKLYMDGAYFCETLEDPIREIPGAPVEQWKVDGNTAIPGGVYQVTITYSPHFGCDMPLVNAVPGFDGVRIHPGNTTADTEGCLLVAENRGVDEITNSRAAFARLFPSLQDALARGDDITIEYVNP